MKHVWIAVAALMLAACASTEGGNATPAVVIPQPPAPVAFAADWDGVAPDAQAWTGYLESALNEFGQPLLASPPSDVAPFCANYAQLSARDKKQFWIVFISAMAKRESNFNPHSIYAEPAPLNQNSIGLLQLSLTDNRSYGCSFANEADIEDPRKNLECGVRIMARRLANGEIGGGGNHHGLAAYWATLRDAPDRNLASRTYIISRTTRSPGCS